MLAVRSSGFAGKVGRFGCQFGMEEDAAPGTQSSFTFCGIRSSSAISDDLRADATDDVCDETMARSFSISASNSWFLLSTLSMLLDRPPDSSSLTFLSRVSICSLVRWRMFRWASRSFARFRANWALLRCVTDRFPPREPFFRGSSGVSMASGVLELVLDMAPVLGRRWSETSYH